MGNARQLELLNLPKNKKQFLILVFRQWTKLVLLHRIFHLLLFFCLSFDKTHLAFYQKIDYQLVHDSQRTYLWRYYNGLEMFLLGRLVLIVWPLRRLILFYQGSGYYTSLRNQTETHQRISVKYIGHYYLGIIAL